MFNCSICNSGIFGHRNITLNVFSLVFHQTPCHSDTFGKISTGNWTKNDSPLFYFLGLTLSSRCISFERRVVKSGTRRFWFCSRNSEQCSGKTRFGEQARHPNPGQVRTLTFQTFNRRRARKIVTDRGAERKRRIYNVIENRYLTAASLVGSTIATV